MNPPLLPRDSSQPRAVLSIQMKAVRTSEIAYARQAPARGKRSSLKIPSMIWAVSLIADRHSAVPGEPQSNHDPASVSRLDGPGPTARLRRLSRHAERLAVPLKSSSAVSEVSIGNVDRTSFESELLSNGGTGSIRTLSILPSAPSRHCR